MWNLVPWDIGSETKVRETNDSHHSIGTTALLRLLELLPKLRTIVFLGVAAKTAIPHVRNARPDLQLLGCPHPSPTNLNTRLGSEDMILEALISACASIKAG
jgi:hypothetical protein